MSEAAELELPDYGRGRTIKQTTSLCPRCLTSVPATVLERDGRVWLDKECARHGRFSALLAADPRHYYVKDERITSVGACCGGPEDCCGDQVQNHTCNMIIEITQRCNLTCPTCYAASTPQSDEVMSLRRFEAIVDELLAMGKGGMDLVQLSGGEPTTHPQLLEIIDAALARGIRRVYINTNGIKLANPEFVERLAERGDRFAVYLQFDGFEPRTLRLLRGREDLVETKLAALDNCERFGIDTVPVMTVTRGINEHELGPFISHMAGRRTVRRTMIQLAMYSGRYDNPRLVERLTVGDAARAIAEQTGGLFSHEDFGPIPCSDPNCFSVALALRTPDGLLPISRYFPPYDTWANFGVRQAIAAVSDSFDHSSDFRAIVDWIAFTGAIRGDDPEGVAKVRAHVKAWRKARKRGGTDLEGWDGLFAVGIKPFMDAYTFDADRLRGCCNHVIVDSANPVCFCEFNATHRPRRIRGRSLPLLT